MSAQKWIQEGIDKGYCSTTCCETHNPDYYTEDEIKKLNSGDDPCVFVVRILDA